MASLGGTCTALLPPSLLLGMQPTRFVNVHFIPCGTALSIMASITSRTSPTNGCPMTSAPTDGASPTKRMSHGTWPRARHTLVASGGHKLLPQPCCHRTRYFSHRVATSISNQSSLDHAVTRASAEGAELCRGVRECERVGQSSDAPRLPALRASRRRSRCSRQRWLALRRRVPCRPPP